MLRKAQRLVLIGGVFCIIGAAGMWYRGTSLARAFNVLDGKTFDVGRDLAELSLAALALGIGVLAVLLGVRALGKGHALGGLGRGSIVLAGCATMLGGAALVLGLSRIQASFNVIALSEHAPKSSELDAMIWQGTSVAHVGFGFMLLGQWPLLFVLLPRFWSEAPPYSLSFGARVALPGVAMAAVLGLIVSFIMATFSGMHAAALVGGEVPIKPAEMVEHLMGVLRYGMIGGICMAAGGVTVALAGLAQPWTKTGAS